MAGKPPPLPPRAPMELDGARSSSPSATSQRSRSSDSARPRAGTIHLTPFDGSRSRSQSPRFEGACPHGAPPPYEENWERGDPRSSSMHSLLPTESAGEDRRTLLLIYIHGFLGDETSFKSFPAHVHNLLTVLLSPTHIVHTKVYPRYKSRRAMDFARDDFSNWLTPHESPRTDVVLVGHSLGGILAAEVALIPSHVPNSAYSLQHRILGVVAIDTPFLGMHPGVIGTGIGSLFRSKPEIPQPKQPNDDSLSPTPSASGSNLTPIGSNTSDPFSTSLNDPYYNPSFPNDVISTQRKFWDSALHFVNKHSDGLTKASKQYVMSHLEFGGCLADYPGMKSRHEHIRALEDIDELAQPRDARGRLLRQVRFVNYYSASTGRLKAPTQNKDVFVTVGNQPDLPGTEMRSLHLQPSNATDDQSSGIATLSTGPRLSLEEHADDGSISKPLDELDPRPMEDLSSDERDAERVISEKSIEVDETSPEEIQHTTVPDSEELPPTPEDVISVDILPPIPSKPRRPPDFDSSNYAAKDTLKLAQKEHGRQVKAYEKAVKDREKSIRDREKLVKKREKAAAKQQEREEKLLKKSQSVKEKEGLKRSATLNPEVYDRQIEKDAEETGMNEGQVRKKKRDRKFCALPPKDPRTGLRDPMWIRVYMEGVDEVVAHTSMFSGVGETYEKLVGDTAARVEEWAKEDATKRMMLEEKSKGRSE